MKVRLKRSPDIGAEDGKAWGIAGVEVVVVVVFGCAQLRRMEDRLQ